MLIQKSNDFVDNLCDWLKTIVKEQPKFIEHLYHQKNFLCVCMYKMVDISNKSWNKARVSLIRIHENVDVNKTLLLLLCISDITKT